MRNTAWNAARRLFATVGYGATSMETIAAEAGVAVRTVYSAFGAKREILSHICEKLLEAAGRGRPPPTCSPSPTLPAGSTPPPAG